MSEPPIVSVERLEKVFALKGRGAARAHVLNDVSFAIARGETLGFVGESGSGKTTTGRILVGLTPATSGAITLFGHTITGPSGPAELAKARSRLQMIFQDPNAALNPRMRVADSVAEPIDIAGAHSRTDRRDRIAEVLELVGLPPDSGNRFPHEFSGGQRQRIVIARALALSPQFVVCDEPVSALDVSMQAQIVNLLLDLQQRFGLSYFFIAHDLGVVRIASSRIAVMYAGTIVEIAPKRDLFAAPEHPYTSALLNAAPRPDPSYARPRVIGGEVPSLVNPPSGCRFHPRCPSVMDRCRVEIPQLKATGPGRATACHLFDSPASTTAPTFASAREG